MQQIQPNKLLQKPIKDIIVPKYVFGYRGDFKNNILPHQVTNKFIYPAANAIIIYDNESKLQHIIQTLNGSRGITCMTISPNRRYIAWSEECETGIIVVYDTKYNKTKTLSTLDCKSRYYVSLDFWPYQDNEGKDGKEGKNGKDQKDKEKDGKIKKQAGKYLVALSGPPEQMLIHWQWEKQKCLGSTVVNTKGDLQRYYFVYFHPKEDDFVCVQGNGAIKPYKLVPDNPPRQKDSPFSKKKEDVQFSHNFLSYCLLGDGKSTVVGTDQGEVLFFTENCEFKLVLPTSPFEGFQIECIIKYSNGFIIGGSDFTIYIFRKHEGDLKNPYVRVDKKIQNRIFPNYKVTSLLLAGQEDTLIIGVDTGQIYSIPFSPERDLQDEGYMKFDHLVFSFHTDFITGMDIAIRKPLVATASLDRSIRIWNFYEPQLELSKEFEDQPYAVAFHPSGFHLICTFLDRISLFNIFENDLASFKEIHIKNCQHIKFSNGGHLFAIANSNIVQVYQFFTGENPQQFVFKLQSGKVQAIEWDSDDLGFYTGGNDGFVHYWRLDDSQNKTQIFYIPNYSVETIALAFSDSYVYIGGPSDPDHIYEIQVATKPLKEKEIIVDNMKKLYSGEPKKIHTGCQISKMAPSKSEKLFYFATNQKGQPGGLRFSNYPFTKDNAEIYELQMHYSGVTQLRVSFDDTYLFTVGHDGALVIYQLMEEQFKVKLDRDGMGSQYAEEFLIQRDKYKKEIAEIETLKHQIKELELKQRIKSNLQSKDRDDKIRILEEQIDQLQSTEKQKYDELLNSKQVLEQTFEDSKRTLQQQHEQNKKTTETDFKQKMQLESQRYEELLKDKTKQLTDFQTYVGNFKQTQTRIEKEKRMNYEEQLRHEKEQQELLTKNKEELIKKFTDHRNTLEESADKRIDDLKDKFEDEMKKLCKELEKADQEKMATKTQFENASQQLEAAHSKLKEILEDIQQSQETNRQYQKEKESHQKEIEERDKTIRDKGRRIYELKKKTQELEKFKFVLDYKIKELKREIGPKEDEITKMKEQIANMQTEILHFTKIDANLQLIVTDLNLRQQGMKREIDTQNTLTDQNDQYILAFEYDISEANQCLEDFKRLKQAMLKLYNKYVQSEQTKKKFENIDVKKEFIKERAYLETTNKALKEKFSKKLRVHKQDNDRIMNQNVDLISEINDLKREIKLLQDEEDLKQLQTMRPDQKSEQEIDREMEQNEEDIQQLRARLSAVSEELQNRRIEQNLQSQSDNNQDSDQE